MEANIYLFKRRPRKKKDLESRPLKKNCQKWQTTLELGYLVITELTNCPTVNVCVEYDSTYYVRVLHYSWVGYYNIPIRKELSKICISLNAVL